MSEQSRRDFLKKAAGAGAAMAGGGGLGGCAPDRPARSRGPQDVPPEGQAGEAGAPTAGEAPTREGFGTLPEAPLAAVADVALPTGVLGDEGTELALLGFLAWVEGFEPAAELDHPYLSGELRYGRPHPGPRWAAQLQAMELEAERRTGRPFSQLSASERRRIVTEAAEEETGSSLPGDPARADHVVVGLLAWFYGTTTANDLGYEARIRRHLCRGIASLPEEPPALEEAG